MTQFQVKLLGGPADGDEGIYDGALAPSLWAGWCKGCREWHWFEKRIPGFEKYTQHEVDNGNRKATYVYSDCNLGGTPVDERELVGV